MTHDLGPIAVARRTGLTGALDPATSQLASAAAGYQSAPQCPRRADDDGRFSQC